MLFENYEKCLKKTNYNLDIISNILSFSHACLSIFLTGLYNFYHNDRRFLLLNVFISIDYYINDIKKYDLNIFHDRVLFAHHIFSIIIIPSVVALENLDISIGFLMMEFSNMPMYAVNVMNKADSKYWKEHYIYRWVLLLEFLFFFIFRCVALLFIIPMSEYLIIKTLLSLFYLMGVFWTYRLSHQVVKHFF